MNRIMVLASVAIGVFGAVITPAKAAGSCIDGQWHNGTDGNHLILTNTCQETFDVTLMSGSNHKRACATFRMEPNATRTYTQSAECHGVNELTHGCFCENEIDLREHQIK